MTNECSNCPYCWKDEHDDYPRCHWESAAPGDIPPCEEDHSGPEYRYSVIYFGFIFEGDNNDWNEHGYNRWEDAISIYDAYHDSVSIYITDNEYGVSFIDDEWN